MMSNNKYFEMKIFLNKIKINFNFQTIKYINKKNLEYTSSIEF
jgi:hypothetical protein